MSISKLPAIFAGVVALAISTANAQAQAHTEQRKDVRSKLFEKILADFPDVRECVDQEEGGRRAAEQNMTVEKVDLNHDGVFEYEVELSGGCACGSVNCTIYLYRETPQGFEQILEDAAGYSFTLLKTSTNGYADVLVTARDSAATRDETTYKFDGNRYREAGSRVVRQDTGESKPAYRRVQFKRGTSSTTLQGRASLILPDTYLIGARAGQVMTIQLTSPQRSVKFMVMNSRTTAMLADNTRSWTGTLPESGDYHIIVEGDEKGGTYTMTISIK